MPCVSDYWYSNFGLNCDTLRGAWGMRMIVFVKCILIRGGKGSADGEVCIFVTFARSITFESIIL